MKVLKTNREFRITMRIAAVHLQGTLKEAGGKRPQCSLSLWK